MATDPDKINVVLQWKQPTTATELQSFLGFASYYHCFAEGFSKLAAPLYYLVADVIGSKHKPKGHGKCSIMEKWNEECKQGFQSFKEQLVSAPVLRHADFAKPLMQVMQDLVQYCLRIKKANRDLLPLPAGALDV